MLNHSPEHIEAMKSEWTDQYVQVNADRPELKRFAGRVGRVVTVNHNGKALIDFADGAWYDITASTQFLTKLDPNSDDVKKFDRTANSAQPVPGRGG